jgi:Protein of unknown function (DUF4013)
MNYTQSVSDFFKSPKWGTSLMLGAVATLIPVVGPIVLTGWLVTIFWARGGKDEAGAYLPFDFQDFGKYLERGLWPFLVSMVASTVLVPISMAVVFPVVIMTGIIGSNNESGPAVALMIPLIILLYACLMMGYHLIATPLMLRATITQNFGAAFDFHFCCDFIKRMWRELFSCLLFMFCMGICMMVITVITCYIGLFFAMPVLLFSWSHIKKQIYQIYLSRGGIVVPLCPKLSDLPPPLPPA